MTIINSTAVFKGSVLSDGSRYVKETIEDSVVGFSYNTYLAPAGWTQQDMDAHLAARVAWLIEALAEQEASEVLNG